MNEQSASPVDQVANGGPKTAGEFEALSTIIAALSPLSDASKLRIVRTVATFFEMSWETAGNGSVSQPEENASAQKRSVTGQVVSTFSEDRAPTAKAFLLEKRPQTDVERIACLAYYLTHYRDQPHFKTLDLSKLNTEAAQIKFSNAAKAADNATSQAHFLIQAGQGRKQLSAIGELYVQALPDRAAAKQAVSEVRRRRAKTRARGAREEVEAIGFADDNEKVSDGEN